ncbi:MAG: septum formation protein Maf [Nitrospiraceae bacterium]|nr:septum formation protein Maf [Nitrospiraceae bacterium]
MRLILASTSPRRKELLSLLGLPFDLASPDYVEQVLPGKTAMDQAKEFAAGKARSCTVGSEDALVLGSDTLIGLDSEVLGKPTDLSEAAAMLRRMSGRRHVIYTGVALVGSEGRFCDVAVDTVQVTMKPFGERELAAYIETGESLGKAGAYSIQGAGGALIATIEGDFTAAVGLPLRLVAAMLAGRGMHCPMDLDRLYRERPYPNWGSFP